MSTNTISFYSNVEAFFSLQQSPIFINMYKRNGEDEKEIWYLDEDNDGYHSEIEESVEPPGGRWTDSTSGEDCDDLRSCVKDDCTKVIWYGLPNKFVPNLLGSPSRFFSKYDKWICQSSNFFNA